MTHPAPPTGTSPTGTSPTETVTTGSHPRETGTTSTLMISAGGTAVAGREAAHRSFLELRRAVYVDEAGYLPPSDGTLETDQDDERSLAFGVVEDSPGGERVVAGLRLIVKGYAGSGGRRLPVETHWPDVFGACPAPAPSVEVSRLISRHPDRAVQHRHVLDLYATVLNFLDEAGLHVVYGLVDPVLERVLRSSLSVERIGERRWVEHYRSENVAIAITVPRLPRLSRWLPGRYATAAEILVGRHTAEEAAA
ncbi:hypothetical protein MT349_11015 [Rathayibacter caricis]|uniref:hypothetical protein n=1 Tax=Rathayibacter caricis TaxID=110936 RepID=UPI001FB48A2B|nr:hypothetical protein [Rathayibacter caricis]MCJ1696314.1 hypothetical protein [Rathayibacter caricis]